MTNKSLTKASFTSSPTIASYPWVLWNFHCICFHVVKQVKPLGTLSTGIFDTQVYCNTGFSNDSDQGSGIYLNAGLSCLFTQLRPCLAQQQILEHKVGLSQVQQSEQEQYVSYLITRIEYTITQLHPCLIQWQILEHKVGLSQVQQSPLVAALSAQGGRKEAKKAYCSLCQSVHHQSADTTCWERVFFPLIWGKRIERKV